MGDPVLREWTIAACIVAIVAAAVDGFRAQKQGPFRVGVDLVSLSVSVTDQGHRYVGDLNRDDFVVTENGVPQELSFFARTGVPLALALLIDTSSSMQSTLDTAQEAAIGFVRHLSAGRCRHRRQLRQRCGNRSGLHTRRRRPAGWDSTDPGAWLDFPVQRGLYRTQGAEQDNSSRRHGRSPRRRAIVLLSDGDDTSSLVSFDEIHRSGLAVRHDHLHDRPGTSRHHSLEPEIRGW